MTTVQRISELLPIPKQAYFPKEQIGKVIERFGVAPHEEAVRDGIQIRTDSAKNVRVVSLDDRSASVRSHFAVKIYEGSNPEAQQSVMYELDARVIANLIKLVAKNIDSLGSYADAILIPPAFGYEHDDGVVLVTDFVDGANYLNTDLAKKLPPEVRALGVLIPLLTGVNQFSTYSFLYRLKVDTDTDSEYLEVALVDLESISRGRKLDHDAIVLFHILKSAANNEDEAVRFTNALKSCGSAWLGVMNDETNKDHLAAMIKATRGGVIVQDAMSPEEIIQNTLNVVVHFNNLGYVLDGDVDNLVTPDVSQEVRSYSSVIDLEYSLKQAGRDAKLLNELMELALVDSQRCLNQLSEAVSSSNFTEIRRCGHTLKRIFSLFVDPNGTSQIPGRIAYVLAWRIEKMGYSGQMSDSEGNITDTFQLLTSNVDKVISAFKIFLRKS